MAILESGQRRQLESVICAARSAAELATDHALSRLGLPAGDVPAGLSDVERKLRRSLLSLLKQVGGYKKLKEQCAFEHWHRLLFARYLAENELLIYPQAGVPVTLEECEDRGLQEEYGATDAWQLASYYAAEMLPALFRPDDPLLRIRFSPEDNDLLESQLRSLPRAVFTAEDSLGWTYQFWQKERKAEVNKAAKPIGGSDLSAVTQLFTEHYMVRFLLENTLGAWWLHLHPDSALVREWEYYKADIPHDHTKFPARLEEITFMDPCCGSGHFIVEAFQLFRTMYEQQGLSTSQAGDAAILNNIHGLELDPRCTQIAAFNLALQAWKSGGYRKLPEIQIACSGLPLPGTPAEWSAVTGGNSRLEKGISLLQSIFSRADNLGSLIFPAAAFRITDDGKVLQLSLFERYENTSVLDDAVPKDIVTWEEIENVLKDIINNQSKLEGENSLLGVQALGPVHAAQMLSRQYWFVATNPPFLLVSKTVLDIQDVCKGSYPDASKDLATTFIERVQFFTRNHGEYTLVSPQNWLFLGSDKAFRITLLKKQTWLALIRLGENAFESSAAAGAFVCNIIMCRSYPHFANEFYALDASESRSAREKAQLLRNAKLARPEEMEDDKAL